MKKHKIVEKNWVQRMALEKDILYANDHPLICGIDHVFQNEDRLYFVMPFMRGGELFKIVAKERLSDD